MNQFFGIRIPPVIGEINWKPDSIWYDDFRQIIQQLADDLASAEAILATIHDEKVVLTLDAASIWLDFNSNGLKEPNEQLIRVLSGLMDLSGNPLGLSPFLPVTFDLADVHWLRGYCHLFATACDLILAYDMRELFEVTGNLLFPRIQGGTANALPYNDDFSTVVDSVALIHLCRFEVCEPDRLQSAHYHLKHVFEQSRLMWQCILSESDDNDEWVPSPCQTGVFRIRVTDTMIERWRMFLDEIESILDGNTLILHPRWSPSNGVNLKRIFFEPRRFDLVLWIQGSMAAPYIEAGKPVASDATWESLQRAFAGRSSMYALWWN